MRKFKFRLDKVLEVREIEEEEVENRLHKARKKAEKIKEEIEQLENTQLELYRYLREKEEVTPGETMQYRRYLHINRRRISNTEEKLINQQQEVTAFRQEYIDKRRNREALEKLKEKDYSRYMKELLLKEQEELDELAQRFNSSGLQEV